jgi:hypothetical protein
MEDKGQDGISFDIWYDVLDELIQRQKLDIAHRPHLFMQRLQQLLGLVGIVCGNVDDIQLPEPAGPREQMDFAPIVQQLRYQAGLIDIVEAFAHRQLYSVVHALGAPF